MRAEARSVSSFRCVLGSSPGFAVGLQHGNQRTVAGANIIAAALFLAFSADLFQRRRTSTSQPKAPSNPSAHEEGSGTTCSAATASRSKPPLENAVG